MGRAFRPLTKWERNLPTDIQIPVRLRDDRITSKPSCVNLILNNKLEDYRSTPSVSHHHCIVAEPAERNPLVCF